MSPLADQFLLRPDIVFLNHGSFGACPRPVFEEYQRWQRELEAQPVEFLGRRFDGLMRAAREPLARYVNCDPDDLVYVPNATVGINIVARSLDLAPGDEVLTTDHEYGALDRTWDFLCNRSGAVYKRQPMPLPVTTPEEFVEQFWAGVTPRTRIIFISHLTSPTALIFPVAEICRRARDAGILSIVDGAHAVGQIPLDMTALGADVYTSNNHKWLLAPKGSAFLYVRRELQPRVFPLVISWGWHPEEPVGSPFVQMHEWQGTRDIASYLATPAAIDFVRANNWEQVRAECHALAWETAERISARTGCGLISSADWVSQMVTIPLPPCDVKQVKVLLYDNYGVEVPVLRWGGREFVRVSVQGYNTRADIDRLVDALGELDLYRQ